MRYIRSLLVILTLFSVVPKASAQVYPTAAFPSQMGPCSIYFDDFYAAMNPKLRVQLQLNDLTTPSRDVYLKVRITGPGVNIISTPGIRPLTPITLFSGTPTELIGADLAPTFDFNALTFGGAVTRQSIEGNGRLPEGLYTVCFTIIDYDQNVVLSQESCIQMQLALSDPPQIINPVCGSVISQINPPNFLFNWMLTNSNSLVDMGNLNYQINLYEVTSNTSNPQNAIMNNQALLVWQSQLLNMYTFNYGITEPVLEVGKRYVFNVQAIENYERSQIKNNGFSAPCWFYYGYPEGGTIELTRPDSSYQFRLSDPGLFSWKRPSNALNDQYVTYDYKVAKIEPGQTPEQALVENPAFDEYTIPPTENATVDYVMPNNVLNQFEKMQPYAWQVKGRSGSQTIATSPVSTFTGPPYLDEFYAANFLIEITQLTSFDTVNYTISGTGRTKLKNGTTERPEFSFHDVKIASAGNNLWIMTAGYIEDNITISKYDLDPKTVEDNGLMSFQPDKIYIDKDNLRLGGHCSWRVPVVAATSYPPVIRTEYVKMLLQNHTFQLAYEDPIELENNYNIPLLEPYGFNLKIEYTTTVVIYQSKYEFSLEGFTELPTAVEDLEKTTVLVPFRNQKQVNFMEEQGLVYRPEQIDFLENANFGLRGEHYFIDLSEKLSPGDRSQDSSWKGVYYQTARLVIPEDDAEETNQLTSDHTFGALLSNTATDSTIAYIDETGLNFRCAVLFNASDSLKFNTFPSTEARLHIDIRENFFHTGKVEGFIQIPFIDTARLFAYTVPLTSFGFELGNIDESLVNQQFVFNAGGSDEERVNMKITRAVFKSNNHIEMDLDASWPHFNATLQNLQSLCAWGNGNIGFEIPNGAAALNDQIVGNSGDYAMVIDYVGCGRDRNAYAFGISAKMNMAENISGDDGAPVVNAYSMYLNPLLSGTFSGSGTDPGGMLPGFNNQTDTTVSQATVANATNLTNDLSFFSDSLGIDPSDTLSLGNDNPNVLISEGTYLQLQRIIEIAEIFVQFIDSSKAEKAADYITVAKQALNSDAVKGAVNKDPKEYLQDIMESALEDLIRRATQPITNATQKATGKFRDLVEDNITDPINDKINTALTKVFDKISGQIMASVEDETARALLTNILNDTKQSLKTQLTGSVTNSVETNITSKITDFIELALVKQVTDYIAAEIRYMGMELIENGTNASINLNHIVENGEELFENIGDTLVSGIRSVSLQNIIKTAESLVDDALNGVDWDQVLDDILSSAVSNGINTAVSELLGNALNSFGGEAFSSLLNNVQFDFSNLGEKLQSGDLSGIVQFDPTNISIKTSACEVRGQLKHTKDDPIYGDHWRAQVDVRLLKPEKLKDVAISALFITGKTSYSAPLPPNFIPPIDTTDPAAVAEYEASLAAATADTTKYSYWFASLGVSGLQVPLSPIPLYLTGVEGFAYHHMQKASPTATPVPCRLNKLGLGVGFDFMDVPGNGKFVKLYMQLEVIINEGAWAMEMYTKANIGNLGSGAPLPSIATATGTMGYYSAIKTFKGDISVIFNTAPVFCAGGQIKFKFDGLNGTWYVSAGTPSERMYAELLCKDWLSITSYVEAQNTGFKAGLTLNIDIAAKSPWLDFDVVKVRGTADFYIYLDAYVDLQFEPTFRLNEAYVYLEAGASIGVDYESSIKSGHFTVAGIALAGHVHYKASPEGNINGGLSGTVTVLGIDCSLSLNVNYDLGNRADNS